jgi:N-hydroxyarylamine O-acetyltransferase
MLAVPFENLDIHLGREILLDEASLWKKIIEQGRGGFCYELNGLFAWLLRTLGFQVDLLSAGVAHPSGGFGPEFDHLTLLVHLAEDWLADVGFGDSFRQPLRMQPSCTQTQEWGRYRLEREQTYWILQEWDAAWKPAYRFTLQPHTLTDFTEMCHYQQTSPASHFTQRRICSIATHSGRTTLSDQRLITTTYGERKESILTSQEEYSAALVEHFGIVL